jgi:hypothetical protein
MVKSNNNKIIAFVGITFIFYVVIETQRTGAQEMSTLEEEMELLSTEKDIVLRKMEELKQEGMSVRLDSILKEANQIYGEDEKERKEGHLWIDREAKTFIITLGALNGLDTGNRLAASVEVDVPMDVISYVHPVDKTLADFKEDSYRIVFED